METNTLATGDWKNFSSYAKLVRTHISRGFNWPRDMLIATFIAGSTAWLQVHYHLVDSTQGKTFWITVLAPYVVVLGIHFAIRAIAAPYHVHREKEKELSDVVAERDCNATKLKEIEDAKPHVVLRDVYTEKVSVNQNGLQVCIANVLRVRLENAPPRPYPNSEAKNVTATISFYDPLGKLLIADMDARWTASTQPVGPHTQSIVPLLGMDLGIGVKRDLDIAFAAMTPYKTPSPSLVALNNDNFRFTCWEKPDHVLQGERLVAEVHVRAVWVDTKFSVEFWVLPHGEIEFRQL